MFFMYYNFDPLIGWIGIGFFSPMVYYFVFILFTYSLMIINIMNENVSTLHLILELVH